MHAARVANSSRLTLALLALREHPQGLTTRDLLDMTGSCAPHSDVAELRANGYRIDCRRVRSTARGRSVYRYVLREETA